MNIGIFTDTYFPQISGVSTSIKMLEKELNKLGHKVYIFTTTDPAVDYATPRVFRLPSMPFLFFPARRVAFFYSPRLIHKLKKLELDVVHTQTEFPLGFFGKVVSEFYKVPLVHTYHTMYEDYVHYVANGHLVTPSMAKKYSSFFCNRANRVITPSEKTRQSLLSYGVKREVDVIPTGLDFDKFDPKAYTKEEIDQIKLNIGLNLEDPVILSLGRVSKEKSIDVILNELPRLLEKIPNAKFVVVGDGPSLEEAKLQAQQLNIQDSVIFTGSQPWEEIGKFYQIADVFVSASLSETQGLTYIEAMASKIPLVVKKDDTLEGIIIHGQTGYFFEQNEDFADIVYHVLTHREEALDAADQGYQNIQQLSSKQFALNVAAVYAEVIQQYDPKQHTIRNSIKKRLKIRRKSKTPTV